ncbi:MAG: hypothetical protein WCO45_01620 [Pseudanabaena sp. ELA607]|jgi:hypothetical protein
MKLHIMMAEMVQYLADGIARLLMPSNVTDDYPATGELPYTGDQNLRERLERVR